MQTLQKVERTFSYSGYLLRPHRSRMSRQIFLNNLHH